jgi:hypothetical protein
MLVAVLSVLNFSLATFVAILLCIALSLAGASVPPPRGALRRYAGMLLRYGLVSLLNPVTWFCLALVPGGSTAIITRNFVTEILYHWSVFGSMTAATLYTFYVPILVQIQASLLLLSS